MRKLNLSGLILSGLLVIFAASGAAAQEAEMPPPDTQNQNLRRNNRPRRILQELGLTREQIKQIRRINQERRPLMQEVLGNWRAAQRRLDQAVYADFASEEEFQKRLLEAQTAYSEFIAARAATEFLIRKTLTPEQLQKFRRLREQFNSPLKERPNQNNPQPQPVRRLIQRKN